MSSFLVSSLRDMLSPVHALALSPVMGALGMLAGRTTTRGWMRVIRVSYTLIVFAKRHCPRVLLPVLTVCLFIPGPIDEIAVILIAVIPILKSRHNRRTMARYMILAWSI
jgi:hypothetical protein